jgi:hypothetical protein
MTLSPNRFDWLSANLYGVDELRFTQNSGDGHWWLMDDFTYNGAAVPEPVTLALTGVSLMMLAVVLRRRR